MEEAQVDFQTLVASVRETYPLQVAEELTSIQQPQDPYNVVENVAGTIRHITNAEIVLAFCGHEMYIIKYRGVEHQTSQFVPRKPDKVIGYYRFPEVAIREIRMREKL